MKISKFLSTIILATVFSSIYLFGLIFWLYSNANDKTLELLKESLSTTSSFFGGITTLVAAYIAANLFNDWKIQHNKVIESSSAREVIECLIQTKIKMKFIKSILKLDTSTNFNTSLVNNDISELVDKIHNLVEDCIERLEVFNLLKNEDDRESKVFLIKFQDLSNSFSCFIQLASVTQKKYIENKSQFITLADRYVKSCDDFNKFLITSIKAK